MNIIEAAQETLRLMKPDDWHYEHVTSKTLKAEITSGDDGIANEPDSYEHIAWMLRGIIDGYIKGEKAHRWIGWAQACIHIHQEDMPLGTFKKINKGE